MFYYFLPITAEITKYSKRNWWMHDSWPPPAMSGNFFSKCNSFFLKFQAKNKFKKIRNKINFLMKKQVIVVIKPKLLTAMTETQKIERYNSWKRKGWLPLLKQNFSQHVRCWQFNSQCVHASCVKSGCVYMHANLIQATCTYKTLKNKRTSNQAQAKITGTENQNLLKT